MEIRLLYFAWVRERIGIDGETVVVPAHVATIDDLTGWLSVRSAGHAAALADSTRLRFAIDQQLAQPDTMLVDGAEVAIFPPVTGG